MPLTLFGFPGRSHDIGVSKSIATPDDCMFFLDFSRPIERVRWLGKRNRVFGPTVGLLVPIVHLSEKTGGYVFGIDRGQPYFKDIPKLWRNHRAGTRTLDTKPVDGLQVIADFGRHFPEDCS
jgi:hypothetical protein